MVKERNYIIALVVAVIALIAVTFISGIQETGYVVFVAEEKDSVHIIIDKEIRKTVEEEVILERAIRLDECLQYCQYEVCKKNCEVGGVVEPECFRKCIDECNNKCSEIYNWN